MTLETPPNNGGSTTARLDRIESQAIAATAAAADAHRAAREAAATAVRNGVDMDRSIKDLKVAILGGGDLLPDDRGALGRLEERIGGYVADAKRREERAESERVSKRSFLLSLVSIAVMFIGVIAGVVVALAR
jgi:hypothetical protein